MVLKQLMLGDWVHLKPLCNGRPDSNCQVCGIGKVTILCRSDLGIQRAYDERVEFIPITKRILRKNGFHPYENESNIYERVDAYEGIYFRIEVQFNRRIIYLYATYHNGHCQIRKHTTIEGCEMYVHELQQAMRLVGLTEIANSFKI